MGLLRAAGGHLAAAAADGGGTPARVPTRRTRLRTPDAQALVSGSRKPKPRPLAARLASGALQTAFGTAQEATRRYLPLHSRIGLCSFGE